ANQALDTLERYKARLDEVTQQLSALEIEDFVTLRDAMTVVQRLELVRRISAEITGDVVELGTDGRLLALQLAELAGSTDSDRELVVRDYLPEALQDSASAMLPVLGALDALSPQDLIDLTAVSLAFGHPATVEELEAPMSPRGYRLLSRVPRLPRPVIDRLVGAFGNLQSLLAATAEDLQTVDGVGEARARFVREGLSRLAESSIVERYD
ncbi:MAG: DNA integrity scanning diadenylate cyclase DisA, partial [Mycobacteriaceae bacterium]